VTEYLQPGVYVEEVSYRARVIDGVVTFAAGVLLGVVASLLVDCIRRRFAGPS